MYRFSIADPGFLSVIPGLFATMLMGLVRWNIVAGPKSLGLFFERSAFFTRLLRPQLLLLLGVEPLLLVPSMLLLWGGGGDYSCV
jgi:hypothetical protein